MERFGQYILKGRMQASMMALLFALLPLLGWLSLVILALVTLRKGLLEGLWILLWAVLPGVVIGIANHAWLSVGTVFVNASVLWLAAGVLRTTVSWPMVLQGSVALGILVVCGVHLVKPDVVSWWQQNIANYLQNQLVLAKAQHFSDQEMERLKFMVTFLNNGATLWFARLATGIITTLTLSSILINLGLARWWQATLFHPGGLKKELHAIRLSWIPTLVFVCIGILALNDFEWAWDVMPLLFALFFVSALALIHTVFTPVKAGLVWLIVFYLLLIIASPYSLLVVVSIGVLDSLINFRARFHLKTS